MKAGTMALMGRRALAAFVAAMLMLSMMLLLADPAEADHIPPTGQVGANCVEFQAGATGTKGPSDYPGVSITLNSWSNTSGDPHDVNFTIAGLTGTQHVDVSVKSGTNVQEDGPYSNGTYTIMTGLQNAISHIRACVFDNGSEKGKIVVRKEVTQDSDTTVVFDFDPTYQSDDFALSHGQEHEADVPAGIYSVSESVPGGWTLQSATCSSNQDGDSSTPELINLSAGETVTCVFVNDQDMGTTTTSQPEETTTTSQPEESTTTLDIGGSTVTTAPESTTTTVKVLDSTLVNDSTTTSIEDEVLDTEVLPFTGADNDMLALLAAGLGMLGTLVLVATRKMEDN
ncbi:MAG: LPXTG cell wall anchor domain-containing protein [Acidimicrobiia bacterium]